MCSLSHTHTHTHWDTLCVCVLVYVCAIVFCYFSFCFRYFCVIYFNQWGRECNKQAEYPVEANTQAVSLRLQEIKVLVGSRNYEFRLIDRVPARWATQLPLLAPLR